MSTSLWSVLWCLRCWLVLRARMFEWLGVTLRLPDTLGLRGVLLPGLTSLLNVHSLSDVRRSVDVSMMSNTT